MTKYEITFIIRPDMEEKEITKTAEDLKKVLESEKAKVITEKAIGQKELAYEIKNSILDSIIISKLKLIVMRLMNLTV